MSYIRKPEICIVLAKKESVLCTAGHHSVWFGSLLGYEIVYQYSDVSIRS